MSLEAEWVAFVEAVKKVIFVIQLLTNKINFLDLKTSNDKRKGKYVVLSLDI